MKLLKSMTWVLSSALALLSVHAAAPAIPAPKFRLCHSCFMPALPVSLPRQGIVLSLGSILSSGSLWYVVDFERAEVARISARADRVSQQLVVVEQVISPLLSGDLSELMQLANRIWICKDALPSKMATDVVWNLWLLDGDDVRREFATGRPDGMAKDVEEIIARVVRQKSSARYN